MRNQNPFLSCKLLLGACKILSLSFFNEAPYALGFVTSIEKELTAAHECAEAFIGDTYKTNSSKMELFAVLTTVFSIGFPIACLLLHITSDDDEAILSWQNLITGFLKSIQNNLPLFEPKFFFTDKDKGQMNAICSAFKMQPSFCVWHMKRVIMFKIRDLKNSSSANLTDDEEKKILDLLTKHYNMHAYLFPGRNMDSIWEIAVADIWYMLLPSNAQTLHAHLMKNRYSREKFKSWGRRTENDGKPFTRTTMMVEAHWSL